MAENSKIEWTDHTFNPWRGCTKVSPGCAHCYAETLSLRNPAVLGQWGPGKPRVLASEQMWKQPLKWNKFAAECKVIGGKLYHEWGRSAFKDEPKTVMAFHKPVGSREIPLEEWEQGESYRPRVFCASLADWLDDEVQADWLTNLMWTIGSTPHLDWLLLTKRPQNWKKRMEAALACASGQPTHSIITDWLGGHAPPNVWLGTTVEDQARANERIPLLLSIPAKVRFLSCEPLLGPVDLGWPVAGAPAHFWKGGVPTENDRIHWVICGGESGGPKARPMHPDWARSLRDQCAAAQVPFFFKQWGEYQAFDASECRTNVTKETKISADRLTGFDRVGKAKAGRLLDGIEHNDFPKLERRAA